MEAVGMTPAEADALMKKVFIEHGRKFTKAEALQLITDEACKTIIKTRSAELIGTGSSHRRLSQIRCQRRILPDKISCPTIPVIPVMIGRRADRENRQLQCMR